MKQDNENIEENTEQKEKNPFFIIQYIKDVIAGAGISFIIHIVILIALALFTFSDVFPEDETTAVIIPPEELIEPEEVNPEEALSGGAPAESLLVNEEITEDIPIEVDVSEVVNSASVNTNPNRSFTDKVGGGGQGGIGTSSGYASGSGSGSGYVSESGSRNERENLTYSLIEKALNWLLTQQNSDGSWGINGWLTGVVVLAFHSQAQKFDKFPNYKFRTQRGLKWIYQYLKKQSSIYDVGGMSYVTMLYAISEAYSLNHKYSLKRQIKHGIDFLLSKVNRLNAFYYFFIKDGTLSENIKNFNPEEIYDETFLEQYYALGQKNTWLVQAKDILYEMKFSYKMKDLADLNLSAFAFQFLFNAHLHHWDKSKKEAIETALYNFTEYFKKNRIEKKALFVKQDELKASTANITFPYKVGKNYKVLEELNAEPVSLRAVGSLCLSLIYSLEKPPSIVKGMLRSIQRSINKYDKAYFANQETQKGTKSFYYYTYYLSQFLYRTLKYSDWKLWEGIINNALANNAIQTDRLAYWNNFLGDVAFPIGLKKSSRIYATALSILSLSVENRYKDIPNLFKKLRLGKFSISKQVKDFSLVNVQ